MNRDTDGWGLKDLLAAARDGENRAGARLLTRGERGGSPADEIAEATHLLSRDAHIVGITGAPGSGKSTITSAVATHLIEEGHHPAGVAVDPSSPLTGGAILGDRVRMESATASGVFVRSFATRGHSGGLSVAVPGVIRVLDACGFGPIVIETVGVGQVEVDVAAMADTTVVVVTRGWGDAVQANKAGLLEVGDIFVVNKADRLGAEDARRDLELMLDLSEISGLDAGLRPPICKTIATSSEGISQLIVAIHDHNRLLRLGKGLMESRKNRVISEIRARLTHRVAEEIDRALEGERLDSSISPVLAAEQIVGGLFRK